MRAVRLIPLPETAVELLRTWQTRAPRTAPEGLIFSTVSGKPISPNKRAADLDLAGLPSRRSAESDVADIPPNLFVVGASEGRPAEGRGGDHGPHEDRYDA
jgi:hypothetical protein